MSNPQQPELARSRKTPAQDSDAVATVLDGQRTPGTDVPGGPIPPDNQPGHHPADEQDTPDLKAFAERLGTVEPSEREEAAVDVPPAGRRRAVTVIAAVAVVAVIVAVLTGRRRRSR